MSRPNFRVLYYMAAFHPIFYTIHRPKSKKLTDRNRLRITGIAHRLPRGHVGRYHLVLQPILQRRRPRNAGPKLQHVHVLPHKLIRIPGTSSRRPTKLLLPMSALRRLADATRSFFRADDNYATDEASLRLLLHSGTWLETLTQVGGYRRNPQHTCVWHHRNSRD